MKSKKSAQLIIPQGTERLHLDEALRHRKIVRDVEDHYLKWGYLPVQTPVVDYFDIYRDFIDSSNIDEIYRLIDRDGELMMVRSDITLFLARQMGNRITKDELPTRVFYGDSILRNQDREDISRNEFFQTGCELIGKKDIEGDLEILILLEETLQLLKLPYYQIHVGSHLFFEAVTTTENRNQLLKALDTRSIDHLKAALRESAEKLDMDLDVLIKIFMFIGTLDEFRVLKTSIANEIPDSLRKYLIEIEELLVKLHDCSIGDNFRIDFSEVGRKRYYSGIVFQAYMEETGRPIASGGRYDQLLKEFGSDTPSIGFSIMLRVIESFSSLHTDNADCSQLVMTEDDFAERYKKTKELRKSGKCAIL